MPNLLNMDTPIPVGTPTANARQQPAVPVKSSGKLGEQPLEAKPLPYLAIGWTPKGEAYYGEGIGGWVRKMGAMALDPTKIVGSTFVPDPNDPTKTISILERYGAKLPTTALKPGEVLSPEQIATQEAENKKQLGNIDAGEWWEIIKDDPGAILRTWGGVVKTQIFGLLDVLNLPQVGIRKLASMGLAAVMEDDIQKNYPDASRAEVNTAFMSGSEMIYSAWLDVNKRDEYMREVMSGTPPAFVVEKLANPWIELAGSVILDPLNLVPFGAAKKGISAADDLLKISDDGLRAAIKIASETKDPMMIGEKLSGVVDNLTRVLEDVGKKQAILGNSRGLFSKLMSAKAETLSTRLNEVVGFVLEQEGKNPDEIAEVLSHMVRTGSKLPGEAAASAGALLKKPYANILFSNAGLETQLMLQRLTKGDLPKFLTEVLENSTDATKLAEWATKKIIDASEDLFPTVNDLEKAALAVKNGEKNLRTIQLAQKFEELKPFIKSMNKMNNFLQDKLIIGKWGYKDLNRLFSNIYMGMSPGYAMRNVLNGTIHLLADSGGVTAAKGLKLGLGGIAGEVIRTITGKPSTVFERTLKNIAEWGADVKYSRALSGIGIIGDETKAGRSVVSTFLRGGQEGEKGLSLATWGDTFIREMKRSMRQGGIPSVSKLIDGGMPKAMADSLVSLVISHKGNVGEAMKVFRKATATGTLDVWKYMPLDDFLAKFLDSTILSRGDELREIFQSGLSREDILARGDDFVKGLVKEIRTGTTKDALTFSRDPDTMKLIDETYDLIKESGGAFSRESAEKFGYLHNLETASRTLTADAAETIKSFILRKYGKDIPEDLAKYITDAHTQITLRDGPAHIAKWDGVRSFTRDIAARSQGSKNVNSLIDELKKFALDNNLPIPEIVPDIDDKLFRNMLWEGWYFPSANKFFVDFSKTYNTSLMSEIVMPLSNKLGLKLENSQELAKFLRANGMDGLVPQLDRAKNNLLDAEDLLGKSLADWHKGAGIAEDTVEGALKIRPVPQTPETFPTVWRALNEQIDNVVPVLKLEIQKRANAFGKTTEIFTNPNVEKALMGWEADAARNMAEARAHATKLADNARDFALLNYGGDRMYADKALAYIFPYHFWYGRTYKNWMTRIVRDPRVALLYQRYRKTLEQLHPGMPTWWKYNLSTNDLGMGGLGLPGIDSDNPLYFNLEATLNPLNGLTGVDFADSNKRVNWWTKAIDDTGKFGPTLFTPLNWLVAAGLYAQGEEDAAVRWAGRLLPQTAMLKSVAYKLGIKSPLPYNELDPFVQFFSGGLDPYERRRVGRALGKMVDDGTVSAEAAMDAAHSQTGDIWNQAVALSQGERSIGNMTSFFLGTGFKARSQSDKQVDEFYGQYFGLWNMRDSLSPDEFNEGMRQLRTKYPWMDVLLISRKPDEQRDGALAYSVMSRVPPGQKSDMMKIAEIDDLSDRFYEDKGDLSSWNKPDRDRFMAGIADMAAVLAMPDDALQSEYYQASDAYKAMNVAVSAQFGEDVLDQVNLYYAAEDKNAFIQLHPEVQQALQFKSQYVLTNPILNKYYGGISMLEMYYTTEMNSILSKKHGDVSELYRQYDELQLTNPRAARAFKKKNLDPYNAEKKVYAERMMQIIVDLGKDFPETPQVPLRTDTTRSQRQESIAEASQPAPRLKWTDWQQILSEPLQNLVLDYWISGEELPYSATYQLDYLAREVGMYDGEEVLQNIGIAIRQVQP